MKRKLLSVLVAMGFFLSLQVPLMTWARSRHDDRPYRVTVPDGITIRASLETTLSTKTARPGDRFTATVRDPVYVEGREVIPYGATIEGRVAEVKRPGHIHHVGKLDISYERIDLPNGDREPLVASTAGTESRSGKRAKINDEGEIAGPSSTKRKAAEVAGAGGIGAAIGAIAGGAKGTAIGGGTGALIGLADAMRRRGRDLELPAGTLLVIRLDRPLRVNAPERR